MPRKPVQRSSHGFSLTELLIVLAVLGILAALLFPVFSSARKRAQDTACVANLQQLGHAMTMYVSDYDGAYPLYADGTIYNNRITKETHIWSDLLKPYLKSSLLACPMSEWKNMPANVHRTGYVVNGWLNTGIGFQLQHTMSGKQEAVLVYPSCTVVLGDARIGAIAANSPDTATTRAGLDVYFGHPVSDATAKHLLKQEPGGIRHHGGANYAFADGHVKWLLPTSVHTARKSDGVTPGFGL